MTQDYTWTDDSYGSGHQATTDLQAFENNLLALKGTFSGTTAPSDLVKGQWWYDTTANILKLRNEANDAWQSVWDFANNKPVVTNNVSADFGAALKDAAAATASLRTLGTGAAAACAGNDARLSDTRTPTDLSVAEGKLAASAVAQAKLKTSTGEVSTDSTSGANLTLPGGEYGFYPQIKSPDGVGLTAYVGTLFTATAYTTNIYIIMASAYTGYARQRYVSSSGEVNWLFFLRDKTTKKIKASWICSDHPCFGNGGNPDTVQHPFPEYDAGVDEIICINPSERDIETYKAEAVRTGKSPLQVINEQYQIDDNARAEWTSREVSVGLPEGHGWQSMTGAEVEPVKVAIRKPDGILLKALKRI